MTRATNEMPRPQRAYVIAMCAVIGAAFAYAACVWGVWPRLTYLPLTGELGFSSTQALSITYIGNVLWGVGGFVVGGAVGAVLCRLAPRAWSARTLHLFGAWAITAILLSGLYFTWSVWPW